MLGPAHWLERAKHARDVADWIGDPLARRLLLEIAQRYETIAAIPGAQTLRRGIRSKGAPDA
jgi:hypothetical protein